MWRSGFIGSMLLVVSVHALLGQNIQVKGTVRDSKTGEPLPGANIFVRGKSLGTTSSFNGAFFLLLDNADLSDSVFVSYIGYRTHKSLVKTFTDKHVDIHLDPVKIMLDEVVVKVRKKKFDVDAFMAEVLREYKRNSRKTPHIAKAHYRETARSQGKYMQFTEGIGYSIYLGEVMANNAIYINYTFYYENTRKSNRSSLWPQMIYAEDGGMSADLSLNGFRRMEVEGALSGNYSYRLDSVYLEDNHLMYSVSYKGRGEKGKFYIDGDNLQVKRINAEVHHFWSKPFNRRVAGKFDLQFQYYNNQPYISTIRSYYDKDGLEHWNDLTILIQKLDEFTIESRELQLRINNYNSSSLITYRPEEWLTYSLPDHPDYKKIEEDITSGSGLSLENQFIKNSTGKYFNPSEAQKGVNELVEGWKKLF